MYERKAVNTFVKDQNNVFEISKRNNPQNPFKTYKDLFYVLLLLGVENKMLILSPFK